MTAEEHKVGRKIHFGLFGKILIAIAGGIALGWALGHPYMPCAWGLKCVNAFSGVFGQILKFIVPLIILGLVAPAIADTGSGAGKTLLAVVGIAYGSTVFAGFLAYFGSALVFPGWLDAGIGKMSGMEKIVPLLKIPPVMDVMTALFLSFMLGLGIVFAKAVALKRAMDELRTIVSATIEKAILPVLPFYIMAMIANMTAAGHLAAFGVTALKIIAMSIVLTLLLLTIQYGVACAVARRNPFKAVWNMLPAYFTALTICSSAATIPVTLKCVKRNGIGEETAGLVVPLCATIHLAGSMTKVVSCAVAFTILAGTPLDFGKFVYFIFMMAITAVAAPGVACGVIMSSLGLLDSILGFTPEQCTMLMTVYVAMDGLGTACNVAGDGAVAIAVDRFRGGATCL
jgi:Na+/H+-dicarboxylate symporter